MFELTSHPARPAAIPSMADAQGRKLDYLRLAVTDRCNLRCRYCMPAEGVADAGHDAVLRNEEMMRLAGLLCDHGVRRIRITGGEPLVRRGVASLMAELATLPSRPEILLTTNGLLLEENLSALQQVGVRRINLSLDSLDPGKWERITRRRGHERVLRAVDAVLAVGMGLKINLVVMPGVNDDELVDFAALTRARPVEVRYIEAMGFDGSGQPMPTMSGEDILARLASAYTLLPQDRRPGTVAERYTIPDHAGRIGIIRGHSRTFCSDCSRLRIDAKGRLRTCLYGQPAVDLKHMLREGYTDKEIMKAVMGAVAHRFADGHAAQAGRLDSMASIGG